MRRIALVSALVVLGCRAEPPARSADTSCFGTRVLSFRDLTAEVVIPNGESCASGSFQVVFTRGRDTLETLTETRSGSVDFIGTADVDGDGRGEFFVATYSDGATRVGTLYAYTDGTSGIARFDVAVPDAELLQGYRGGDRFGFGGANQLVRAFPRGGGDSVWLGYSHGESKWSVIPRPSWVR